MAVALTECMWSSPGVATLGAKSWRIGATRGAFEGSPIVQQLDWVASAKSAPRSFLATSLPCEHQTANTSMQAAQRTIGSHGTALHAASCSSSTSSSRAGFRRPFSGARLQQAGKRSSRLRAAELEELDEIDPMTVSTLTVGGARHASA